MYYAQVHDARGQVVAKGQGELVEVYHAARSASVAYRNCPVWVHRIGGALHFGFMNGALVSVSKG